MVAQCRDVPTTATMEETSKSKMISLRIEAERESMDIEQMGVLNFSAVHTRIFHAPIPFLATIWIFFRNRTTLGTICMYRVIFSTT
jgi:hypothetical protein